jgi:hypothetical protein
MPIMTAQLSEALVKATHANDVNDAFNRIFTDYLELKLNQLDQSIEKFQAKWDMSFEEFKSQVKENTLKKDSYSFETENDFWQWEEAETLKEHYIGIKNQWM